MTLSNLLHGEVIDLESVFLWEGLRSFAFHVAAESKDAPAIVEIRRLLSHPGICFTVEELCANDACHVMEEDFRRMQEDVHSMRAGNVRIPRGFGAYRQEMGDLRASVTRGAARIFRFKVLVEAKQVEKKYLEKVLSRISELRG